MFTKKEIQLFYNQLLSNLEDALGNDITSGGDLDRIGSSLFMRKWKGVHAANEPYDSKGYNIVNLDDSGSPGTHWVAVANGHVYDSFARCGIIGEAEDLCAGDGKADQKLKENNCGQRCLAWLCVYDSAGLSGANLV